MANEEHAVISGFLNLVRNSASVISVANATAIVTMTMGSLGYPPSLAAVSAEGSAGLLDAFVTGLRYAYWLMAAMLIVGSSVYVCRHARKTLRLRACNRMSSVVCYSLSAVCSESSPGHGRHLCCASEESTA